jgi:hypothetical protein
VQATNVHCMGEKAGRHQAPILPLLLSAEPARLPDNASVPPPVVPQVCPEPPGCRHVKLSAALLCVAILCLAVTHSSRRCRMVVFHVRA